MSPRLVSGVADAPEPARPGVVLDLGHADHAAMADALPGRPADLEACLDEAGAERALTTVGRQLVLR